MAQVRAGTPVILEVGVVVTQDIRAVDTVVILDRQVARVAQEQVGSAVILDRQVARVEQERVGSAVTLAAVVIPVIQVAV